MLVAKALEICDKIINKAVEEYKENPDNQIKDDNGNVTGYKSSPLLLISDDDVIFQLGISLVNVALQTIPISLLEDSDTSTASVLKMVTTKKFVRVPKAPEPVTDDNKDTQQLDIDDALAYAVIFDTLANLWDGFSPYGQKSNLIIMNYNNAYKNIIQSILNGTTAESNTYTAIRFSADNENWHDNYQDGDVYISFKRPDTGDWTAGIRFVGKDGTPCSDTQFIALQDTPSTYSGMKGKIVAVNNSENGLAFIDPPSGDGSGGASTFTDLSDTPSSYGSADANAFVVVNSSANGLAFKQVKIPTKTTDLSDMPTTLTAGKYLAVNSNGDAYELVDAPSGGGTSTPFYSEATGDITLDGFTYTNFLIYPQDDGDVTLKWKADDNGDYGVVGQTYNINVAMYNTNKATLDDDGGKITYVGDTTIADGSGSSDTNTTLTYIKILYIGSGEFVVLENKAINDV